MRIAHLIFGTLLFITFLITGRFMRADFPDKEAIDQAFRLLMRSRHIYILLASLTHIVLGLYLTISAERWRKYLQILGSAVLFAGSFVLVWAFVYETYTSLQYSPYSRYGLYSMLAGTIVHVISKTPDFKK